MKKTFFLVFFCVFYSSIVFGQDLSLNTNDLRIEIRDENGFHLFIRKKAGVSSVLLTESTRDTAFRHDNFAYRARSWNAVNGNETRLLNGVPISSGEVPYSLISSTEVRHPELGAAFQIYIPEIIEYGHAPNRHGEVHVGNGTFINIRTFALPYADYRGSFADNPFTLSGLDRTGRSNDNFTSNDQRQFVQTTRNSGVTLPPAAITTVTGGTQTVTQNNVQTVIIPPAQTSPDLSNRDLSNLTNRQAEADRQITALNTRLTQIENENQRLAAENRRLTEQAALNRGDGTVTHICDQVCDHDCNFDDLLARQTETDRQIAQLRNTIEQLSAENRRLTELIANRDFSNQSGINPSDLNDTLLRQAETDRQIAELRNRIDQLAAENRRLADQLANQQRTTPAQTTETVTQRQTEQPRTPTNTTPRERRPIYTGSFIGLGPEINGNTRESFSAGICATGGIELINTFALGLKVAFSLNFHTVYTLEPSLFLRYIPFNKQESLIKGLFIEASGGYGLYFEYENTYPFPIYAVALGCRFDLPVEAVPLYIEPVGKFGNPFTWGFGVSVGIKF